MAVTFLAIHSIYFSMLIQLETECFVSSSGSVLKYLIFSEPVVHQ